MNLLTLCISLISILTVSSSVAREHAEENAPPEQSRPENKYSDCYCVLHKKGEKLSCSLAGSDNYQSPYVGEKERLEWAQNPKGVFAEEDVKNMRECRSWCDAAFPQKQPIFCKNSRLSYLPEGVSPSERTLLQIEDCKAQGIEMPPAPFSGSWKQMMNSSGNASLAQDSLWVQIGNGYLWKWNSSSGKTHCVGMRRWDGKEEKATGIICWSKTAQGDCPTCFFDRPTEAPSPDGKKIGSALKDFNHHESFDRSPQEVCTNCHMNKSNPILFSPNVKNFFPDAPDCKSFSAIGFEMYKNRNGIEIGKQELKSCATCHEGWDKEFSINSSYAMNVLKKALTEDKNGKSYMPQGRRAHHEEAIKFLERLISDFDPSKR